MVKQLRDRGPNETNSNIVKRSKTYVQARHCYCKTHSTDAYKVVLVQSYHQPRVLFLKKYARVRFSVLTAPSFTDAQIPCIHPDNFGSEMYEMVTTESNQTNPDNNSNNCSHLGINNSHV